MNFGNSKSIVKILLILLISSQVIASSNILLHNDGMFTPTVKGNHRTLKSERIKPLQETITFLGHFLRGRDKIKINLTAVDSNGDPIADADIFVYLNYSHNSIYIGSNKTDESGNFIYEFRLLTSYPDGPVNITAILPADPFAGRGEARYLYSAVIYSKLFVSVYMPSSAPLYQKNETGSTRAFFDNGTLFRVGGLNFTILINDSAGNLIDQFDVTTDDNGVAQFLFDYSLYGEDNYTITSILNATKNLLFLPNTIMEGENILRNGTIIGDPISVDSTIFRVILATRTSIYWLDQGSFTEDLTVLINETVSLVGFYLNASGQPEATSIILYVYNDTDLVGTVLINTNESGMFSLTFNPLNQNLELGNYKFTASDTNETTQDITNQVTLTLVSIPRLNIIKPPPTYLMTGDKFNMSGRVLDDITNEPVAGANVRIFAKFGSSEILLDETLTNLLGFFDIQDIELPTTVTTSNVSLSIVAIKPFYLPSNVSFTVDIYNFIIVDINVNNTVQSWQVGRGFVAPLSTVDEIEFRDTSVFLLTISVRDNHDRPMSLDYSVYLNGELVESSKTDSSGFDTIYLELNNDSLVEIEIEGFSVISLSFVRIVSRGTTPGVNLWYLAALIPVIIVGSLLVRLRNRIPLPTKIKEQKPDLSKIVEDLQILLQNKMYDEAGEKIRELIRTVADSLGVEWKKYMTPRELLYEIYPKIEKDIYRVLEDLVSLFELIFYGEKVPSNTTVDVILDKLPRLELFTGGIYT